MVAFFLAGLFRFFFVLIRHMVVFGHAPKGLTSFQGNHRVRSVAFGSLRFDGEVIAVARIRRRRNGASISIGLLFKSAGVDDHAFRISCGAIHVNGALCRWFSHARRWVRSAVRLLVIDLCDYLWVFLWCRFIWELF